MYKAIFLVYIISILVLCSSSLNSNTRIQGIRGGLVPQATDDLEYFEQFRLDYGNDDKTRAAGSLKGFIKTGNLASLSESDPFLKWINEHLEKGPEPIIGRLKPFYVRI
jgi:hypothetical protein